MNKQVFRLYILLGILVFVVFALKSGELYISRTIKPTPNTAIQDLNWDGHNPIFQYYSRTVSEEKVTDKNKIIDKVGKTFRGNATGYAFQGQKPLVLVSKIEQKSDNADFFDSLKSIRLIEEYLDGKVTSIDFPLFVPKEIEKSVPCLVGIRMTEDGKYYLFSFGEWEQDIDSKNLIYKWDRESKIWDKDVIEEKVFENTMDSTVYEFGYLNDQYDDLFYCEGFYCQYTWLLEDNNIAVTSSWWGRKSLSINKGGINKELVTWFNNDDSVRIIPLKNYNKFLLSFEYPSRKTYILDVLTGQLALFFESDGNETNVDLNVITGEIMDRNSTDSITYE